MKLQRLAAFGVATLAAIGLTVAAATPALAHDELRDKGLEINNATGELSALVFSFSNDIMDVGTEIVVTDEGGKNVASGDPEVTGPNVRQPLDAPLAAGSYQVVWRVVSSDGHPIEGNFGVNVAADGTAEIVGSSEAEHADEEHGEADDSADGHGEEGHHDEAVAPISAPAAPGMPVGGWIAIAAALIAVAAVTVVVVARKGKKLAEINSSGDAANVPGEAAGDTAAGGSAN